MSGVEPNKIVAFNRVDTDVADEFAPSSSRARPPELHPRTAAAIYENRGEAFAGTTITAVELDETGLEGAARGAGEGTRTEKPVGPGSGRPSRSIK